MKLFLVFALSITIFTQNAFTQTKGSISGKVIDKSTQKPLYSANIALEGYKQVSND